MKRLIRALLPAAVALAAAFSAADDTSQIQVRVTGAEAGVGQLFASLFDSKKSYMKEPLARVQIQVDERGGADIDFGAHPPGDYAVTVVYDRDSNGKLNTGLFGIPKEPIGFSNNARGKFGPPKWKASRFEANEDILIEIQVRGIKD